MNNQAISLKSHGFMVISVVIWGVSTLVNEHLYQFHSPISMVFISLFITGISIVMIDYKKVVAHFHWIYIFTGLLGHVGYYVLTGYALVLSSVGFVSIMVGSLPIMSVLFDRVVYKKGLDLQGILISVISVIGMTLLAGFGHIEGHLILAGALCFLANFGWLIYLHVRHVRKVTDALHILGLECLSSSVVMLPFVFLMGGFSPIRPIQIPQILYVSLGSTGVAYYLHLLGTRRLGATVSAIYLNIMPVISIVGYIILYGQTMSMSSIAGGVLVGVAATMTYKMKPHYEVQVDKMVA